ncbi:uncharacterized protein MYCFIDRAFT_78520 [Pseudocercospora fijiensis CIRAD86]|uniref:Uncharacterized protein n=1 Tax=Pseudocercospora fijiensis (strain CIRAD86) TaxID=383855 RepID=N1QBW5_PSEFD|nr:uncharacterized protein MYCFIDRAFT_78520 [Pseudocercospora fijiensis CIRAD86]EME89696.1 hypothetical protein MYCFIDRAFT_78520 [Pseudocercospora fijiensis CIRAD86]
MHLTSVFPYLCLAICAQASRLVTRQSSDSTLPIHLYIQQVQTVIYAIDHIKLNESETACNDDTTEARLNATGLDGPLGHLLLCEDSIGIVIFPNITQAERDIKTALSALQAAQNGTNTSTNCNNLRLDALAQAGIDPEAINLLLCDASKAPIPTPSPTPLWTNTTNPYENTISSPTGTGIRANSSRLALAPLPSASSSSFITTMANGAALTLSINIPLNSPFSTILTPNLSATPTKNSQKISSPIPLNATITVTSSTTTTTTTLPPGPPLTRTSTSSRNPRTLTIWQIVYVTPRKPPSTSPSTLRIPLTATFSTQLVPVVVTVTSTTSIFTTTAGIFSQQQQPPLPPVTLTQSQSVRDPRTVTVWEVVYVTAISRSNKSVVGGVNSL